MREWWQYVAVFAASLVAGLLFIREPGFGDELGYWSLAFDLHEGARSAWSIHSFHDLRWPVWGMSWLWQAVFGPGLASYYCTPILYLAAASVLVFAFGKLILRSVPGAWAGVVACWFLPVLDPVISRAMPDLSESFYGSAALLAWWAMMKSEHNPRAAFLGIVSGLCIGLAFSNRITGIFIAPVLALATLALFPRRWRWLVIPAVTAALWVVVEGAIYHSICGDWLHSIHANLGGRGAKDTGPIALWQLPVRYLGGFFKGNRLSPVFAVSAAIGLWAAWRRGATGRLLAIWFATLYFEYSCAVQSLHPVRPLIGSTYRYLGAFCIPLSLLAVLGAIEIGRFLRARSEPLRAISDRLATRPVALGLSLVAVLGIGTSRPLFDPGFTVEFTRHLAALPTGTKVFTHHAMRDLAFLVDPRDARRLVWNAPSKILFGSPELEAQAAASDEFWYLRKHLWLTYRKAGERSGTVQPQPPLPSYLDTPERDWTLDEVLMKADEPELVFYRRRTAGTTPRILGPDSPEFAGLLPKLPATWKPGRDPARVDLQWPVPPALRGQLVTVQFQLASPAVEPLALTLRFTGGGSEPFDCAYRPIVYSGGGKEFLALKIPAGADQCSVQLNFNKDKPVVLSGFRVIVDVAGLSR
jgi:hypothetical protein